MKYRLGKLPARPVMGLRFADVFNSESLPTPPDTFGHQSLMADGVWHMLGNDSAGDCTIAGAAHEHMLWTMEGGTPRSRFTTKDVLSDYSAVTGYNGTASSDTGADMQVVAAYRQKTGIVDATGARHKIDAFASLRSSDLNQLAQAVYLFGAAGMGFQLPASAEYQFDRGQPWTVVPGDKIEGGHYVPCVGRDASGNFLFISWGKVQAATPGWVTTYMDEGLSYFSREILNAKGVSPEAYDLTALQKYFGEF